MVNELIIFDGNTTQSLVPLNIESHQIVNDLLEIQTSSDNTIERGVVSDFAINPSDSDTLRLFFKDMYVDKFHDCLAYFGIKYDGNNYIQFQISHTDGNELGSIRVYSVVNGSPYSFTLIYGLNKWDIEHPIDFELVYRPTEKVLDVAIEHSNFRFQGWSFPNYMMKIEMKIKSRHIDVVRKMGCREVEISQFNQII